MLGKYFKIHTGEHWAKKVAFRVNHPIIPTLIFSAMALLWIYLAQTRFHFPIAGLVAGLLVGTFLWTFIEYLMHRFVFHWTKVREPWRSLFSELHIAHHRDTEDPGLIIAPPVVALVDSVFLFLILWALTWHWGVALILLAGIDIGYVFYEWAHFGAHEFNWKRGPLGYMRRHHLYHHFKKPSEAYGVTVPWWDMIFGTHQRPPLRSDSLAQKLPHSS